MEDKEIGDDYPTLEEVLAAIEQDEINANMKRNPYEVQSVEAPVIQYTKKRKVDTPQKCYEPDSQIVIYCHRKKEGTQANPITVDPKIPEAVREKTPDQCLLRNESPIIIRPKNYPKRTMFRSATRKATSVPLLSTQDILDM